MATSGESDDPASPPNGRKGRQESKHPLEYMIFVFVVATAIATGFAAYYTRSQWQTAVDAEQKQTRAYVFLRDIRLERFDDTTFDIIPEWENTGVSETVNMRSHLNRALSDVELPQGFSFGDLTAAEVPNLLGPKAVSNIAFDKIWESCLNQFNRRDGFVKFYLWGRTTYNDILTSETHQTRFCWDVSRVVFSEDGRSARLSHTLCESGNCADHDCPSPDKMTITFRNLPCKPALPTSAVAAPPHDAAPEPASKANP